MRRYHDAFDYDESDRNYDSTAKRLRSDYDVSRAPASIRREQIINMLIFRRSRIVVESNANRNLAHIRRSRMRRGIVVS